MLNRDQLETNVLELHTNLANSLSKRIDLHLGSLAQKTISAVNALRVQGLISPGNLQRRGRSRCMSTHL